MVPFRNRSSNGERKPLFGRFREDVEGAGLEFCGTFLFLLIGLGGVQAAATAGGKAKLNIDVNNETGESVIHAPRSIEQVFYISTSMALSLLMTAWLFYRVTGGLFNPCVSTALLLVGKLSPVRYVLYCVAQITGAIAAAAVLMALTPTRIDVNTRIGRGINPAQAVFIEMFLTTLLILAVLMMAAEKNKATAFAPIGAGFTIFATHLFGVAFTGASMNPARSFGPAVLTGFEARHWVYWVGPLVGSLLGVAFYSILKHIRYWTLNPDQESSNPQKSPEGPQADTARHVDKGPRSSGSTKRNVGTDHDITPSQGHVTPDHA
ncbi:hypothetical protein FRC02_010012 [Tulasnella sp. 418]|nr:hypothetical protein FRC02_010012 [Tulasnella sp. 418]